MMTRKNYIEIARIMREAKANSFMDDSAAIDQLCKLEDALVRYLASDNPNFDNERFIDACDPFCVGVR